MRLTKLLSGTILIAALVLAQGPPPGPRGEFGFGGPGGRGRGPGGGPGPRMNKVVTGSPYSAVETRQTTQILSDGTQINRSETSTVYRDSQGRVRTETTMARPARAGSSTSSNGAAPETRTMVTIFDPVEGSTTRLDTQRLTADKTMFPTGDSGRRGPPPQGAGAGPRAVRAGEPQPVKLELGTKTINGLSATGTRTTNTIAAGEFGNSKAIQSVHEVWMSSELQEPLMITTSDPRFGTSTTTLNNVTRNEPDPALFVTPSTYKVTTHSRPGGPPR